MRAVLLVLRRRHDGLQRRRRRHSPRRVSLANVFILQMTVQRPRGSGRSVETILKGKFC